ncbi:MAG: hypothetical protein ACI9CZ_001877, partial [Flavobacterium sp.]
TEISSGKNQRRREAVYEMDFYQRGEGNRLVC